MRKRCRSGAEGLRPPTVTSDSGDGDREGWGSTRQGVAAAEAGAPSQGSTSSSQSSHRNISMRMGAAPCASDETACIKVPDGVWQRAGT